ncbi:cob(I)yrinic acid a c-diamide adenosyltransferase [Citromicrobium sp. RCC1885]|uniref:cob(I)yrinic acid a,c-diamide adenosyltransferase n=1 Tax=unclassified Citromicrobium TaxID=2630544 RepID=UPI0006C9396C|nr:MULTISPECIES: cob(I)yrinic acid a,c-diamide adenosyltransferase [unclassified Citromicrobium]KPM24257.1 cob(I)yrinic acid a c-diamide adenosyltransferase [Citromicrobium sp. RCC1885]KPM27500.1 cob(I)yrinic acid a c-diamide adenosyltransferase [Citromicrobium sp. RCC1878]MAO03919.1 ATP:cob(I)alamin adenosyltransferase [Citromicrobium sp.]OAM11017.1 cob(I)yrinic acid a c-diamide adenosyltransferase [Citromicrobium sp. RCC1897]|tara:strand:- start:9412 stop:9999 length:588 start_codon:yes stop_codon:yes gene_type:complete
MVKLNKIYTRTGDDGTTGLVDGSRSPKHAARIEAIGAVDEANSALGLAICALDAGHDGVAALRRVQNDLFDLGADLATPKGALDGEGFEPGEMVLRIVDGQVDWIERAIDTANENLEPLTSFILPGGSEAAARLHVARASVRKAERAMTALAELEPVNPAALHYINRLSDLLFVLARAANDGGKADITWTPGANR